MRTKNRVVVLILNIIFIFELLLAAIFADYLDQNIIFLIFSTLSIIQTLNFFYKKSNFFEIGVWFIYLSYLFLFGNLFIVQFDLKTNLIWNPFIYFSRQALYFTYLFSIASLYFFQVGYILVGKKLRSSNNQDICGNNMLDTRMKRYGLVILICILPFRLVSDYNIINVISSSNSYSSYSTAVSSGISDDLGQLLLPSLFLLLFSKKINNNIKFFLFSSVLCYLIFFMGATGSRKVSIFSIVVLILGFLYSMDIKKIKITQILSLSLVGILLINFMVIIRDNRFQINTVFQKLLDSSFSIETYKGLLAEVLAELGVTVLSITSTIEVVPNILPFQFGLSFIRAMISFLPIGWLLKDFLSLGSTTYVINRLTGVPVGSSLISEVYWNFGIFGGIISMFIIGMIFGYFVKYYLETPDSLKSALYFSIFSQIILLVRSGTIDVFRTTIFIIIIFFTIRRIKIE
ncbi:TPA: oligosaccharide repeat unit polymerase [Streptococcus suis]|uniref:Wzy n=1 Tax=Streptococcus suis TaxID=1307 RepID=A0A1P8VRA8_STRSU|nr:Wzy [Streptococcus suis]APZ79265.1 Wzy [Streptococcus suis]HEM2786809.1 oligosaccharide repeat unit polymerase [Streptococcus suis]